MNPEFFKCPECGSTESSEGAFVETVFNESDPWSGVLQHLQCAKCGFIIPAHIAELWDGLSQEAAIEDWRRNYRATAPKSLGD